MSPKSVPQDPDFNQDAGSTDFTDIHEIQEDRFSLACNIVAVVGKIVSDVECFSTRSGMPKISFRIAIPRTPDLPRKKPASGDFFTVNCYGKRFAHLLDILTEGQQVVVIGWVQSRDVDRSDGPRIVHEIGARAVIPILDSLLLSALESLVAICIQGLTPQARRDLLETLTNNGQPDAVQVALGLNGNLHPEIRQALLRALIKMEKSGGS